MAYASSIITLSEKPARLADPDGKSYIQSLAQVAGPEPVKIILRAHDGSVAAKALADRSANDRLIVSGELSLQQPAGDVPIITSAVLCSASEDQYLNEVVIVGRVGNDAREAASGKSTRRSIAVNRYFRAPDATEPTEVTDWYLCRAFGFIKERLEAVDRGSLVEVNGFLSQMTSEKGDLYCEVKTRFLRVHRASRGGGNPAAGTAAVGYDRESLQGEPDACPADWS